ncbi:MAG: hypothetical protein ACOYOU_03335 [Kiritimatiellia bacterium]
MSIGTATSTFLSAIRKSDPDGCIKCVITLPNGDVRAGIDAWASGRSGGLETVDWQTVPTVNRTIYMVAQVGIEVRQLDSAIIETRAVNPPSAIESLRIISVHEYPGRAIWRLTCVDKARAM